MVVAEVCSSMKYPKRCQYKHAKQKKYHVRNWAEYNEGLRRRGDLTVWFDEEDTKLLIYGLFRKGRVLAQDGSGQLKDRVCKLLAEEPGLTDRKTTTALGTS